MSQWDPQGCIKVAESHLSLAGWFRHHGDVKAAEFCEAWARWYHDRAEGKTGEDVLPAPSSCCRYHAMGGTRKSCGHATPQEIVPPKVRDYMASLHTDVVTLGTACTCANGPCDGECGCITPPAADPAPAKPPRA